mgnify:CR=1 FL=1|jgi:glycosyltransferase involved in cell wall biosynthesis
MIKSIIVPVFNEANNILVLLKKIELNITPFDQIIIIDDGSTDGTYDEIKNVSHTIIKHESNLGKGRAIINGIKASKGDLIILIDGDGQDDPSEIPKLINGINQGYDFVIGSRFVEDEHKKIKRFTKTALSTINWFGNKSLTMMINLLFNLNIKDSQSGFKCIKTSEIKKLNLVSPRYEIETEIIIKSKRNGLKILEVPVHRYERKHGISNLFDIPFGRVIFLLKVLKVMIYGFFFWTKNN